MNTSTDNLSTSRQPKSISLPKFRELLSVAGISSLDATMEVSLNTTTLETCLETEDNMELELCSSPLNHNNNGNESVIVNVHSSDGDDDKIDQEIVVKRDVVDVSGDPQPATPIAETNNSNTERDFKLGRFGSFMVKMFTLFSCVKTSNSVDEHETDIEPMEEDEDVTDFVRERHRRMSIQTPADVTRCFKSKFMPSIVASELEMLLQCPPLECTEVSRRVKVQGRRRMFVVQAKSKSGIHVTFKVERERVNGVDGATVVNAEMRFKRSWSRVVGLVRKQRWAWQMGSANALFAYVESVFKDW